MSLGIVILVLLLVALLLMAVEVYVAPGFGISGVLSALCAVAADVLIYNEYGGVPALLAILVFGGLAILMMWWVGRSKALDKMSLHSTIDSSNASHAQLSVKVGDEGVALTRLALIGNAEIGGKTVEVKSAGNFIEEGTPLVVVNVNEALILVREKVS